MTTEELLKKIHGDGICHICKCKKIEKGLPICSYPHARISIAPIDSDKSNGFWSWDYPSNKNDIS